MATNKHIILLIILPLIIWGVFILFEDSLNFKPKPIYSSYSFDEEIVMKYLKLQRLLEDFKLYPLNTEILNKLIKIKNSKKTIKKDSVIRWNLRYIIITDTKKIAYLNGNLVKIGDIINGAVVIDIKKDCVLIKTKKGKKCIFIQ